MTAPDSLSSPSYNNMDNITSRNLFYEMRDERRVRRKQASGIYLVAKENTEHYSTTYLLMNTKH